MLSEERRNRNSAIRLIVLTVIAGAVLFFWGIPLLGRFAAFVSELAKGDKPIVKNDNTPPAPPQIDNLPEFTKDESLKVNGTSEEGATIKITFNSNEEELVANSEGKFSKTFKLKRGQNTFILSAKDISGNESQKTQTYNVVYDNTPPELTLESPDNGASFFGTRQRQVDIKGKVDDSESTVTINDRFVAVDDSGAFQFTTTLSEGENKFTIKAVDQAGNSTEKSLTLNFSL